MLAWSAVVLSLEWLIRLGMLPVVIRRKSQPAICLAWLTIIFLLPFLGLFAYLLIGEVRLGARRVRRHARDVDVSARADRPGIQAAHVVQPKIEGAQQVILHVAANLGGMPTLGANSTELLTESACVIQRLIQDIDEAQHHVHLLFYIFIADEVGQKVVSAMCRARTRGVRCRLLVDAVGSRRFLRSSAAGLIRQGVEVASALPVQPLRRLLARIDLRNHRKLAVIDGQIAYTGSQNVVRPDYGKKGVGEWRDLMVRVAGPTVSQLQSVFLEDWEFETGQIVDEPRCFPLPPTRGRSVLQVVPSGPNHPSRVLRDLVVEGLHAARERAIITTPYFVPDEAMLVALRLAAARGVRVDLVAPARGDQLIVELAAQFFFHELIQQGVHVHLYQEGLLHAKVMTVDNDFAMLGTANFDFRSFYLNFELNLLSYDAELNGRLRLYQCQCIEKSKEVEPVTWRNRGALRQWGAQFAKLLGPLL